MNLTKIESVAKVIIVNEKKQVLILTVGDYKERPDKSFKPDLPGGRVEDGEDERSAAAREAKEETGIDIPPAILRLVYAETELFLKENKSVTKLVYVSKLSETPNVTISWEHVSYDWVPFDRLRDLELRPFYRRAVDYCIENNLITEV